jgi:serine kinase of HPr protein (carbohydrate metabolism regulator)
MNVHGTGIVLAGTGVMMRGPSGSGKSLLALLLIDSFALRGEDATLVADDQLELTESGGVLTMTTPSAIAGMIELRGRGIVSRPHVARARLGLVVDLVETLERMPEESAFSTELLGVTLPRCPVPRMGVVETSHQLLLVREALAATSRTGAKSA